MPPAVPADVEGAAVDPVAAPGVPVEREDDLYTKLKTLQRQLEFLDIQEEYIKVRSFEIHDGYSGSSAGGLPQRSMPSDVSSRLRTFRDRRMSRRTSRGSFLGHRRR